MNYKFILISLMVMSLSGCFSTKAPEQSIEQNQDIAPLESAREEGLTENDVPKLDPDQLFVQNLYAQANLYLANKKTITPAQRTHMLKALSDLGAESYENGLNEIDAALSLGTLNSASYVIKADIHKALEQHQEAELALQKALEINPHNPKAANRLATYWREQGEFEDALTLYNAAILAAPTHAPSYRNRGVLHDLYLADKASALNDYQTYALLLAHQNTEAEDKQKEKQIKLVKGWLVDVERQLAALARNSHEE